MNKRIILLIIMVFSLCGIANAQMVPGLKQYHQLFGYILAGLTVILVGLLAWEIQFQISRRRGSETDTAVSIIGASDEVGGGDDEDPIKALLKAQAKSSGTQEDEEEVLPPFLQDEEKPSPTKANVSGATTPADKVEGGGDPFKMLLMKSAHEKEEKTKEKTAIPVAPPPKPPSQPHFKRPDDDPFKELLKSQETKTTPAPPTPKKQPKSEVRHSKPSADTPKRKLSFAPPKTESPKKAEKKISFSLPSQKKSAKGSLFTRLGGESKQKAGEPGRGTIKPPGPSKPPISPEALEKTISIDSERKDQVLKIPDGDKVILKKPERGPVPRKEPPRLKPRKQIELDLRAKPKMKAKEQPRGRQSKPPKGKRLSLDLKPGRDASTSKLGPTPPKRPGKQGSGKIKLRPKFPGKGKTRAPETKRFEK